MRVELLKAIVFFFFVICLGFMEFAFYPGKDISLCDNKIASNKTVKTIIGNIEVIGSHEISSSVDNLNLVFNISEGNSLQFRFTLLNGHLIRLNANSSADNVLLSSCGIALGTTGFFYRNKDAAIEFVAEKMIVETAENARICSMLVNRFR